MRDLTAAPIAKSEPGVPGLHSLSESRVEGGDNTCVSKTFFKDEVDCMKQEFQSSKTGPEGHHTPEVRRT